MPVSCKERILSNDYADWIIDFELTEELRNMDTSNLVDIVMDDDKSGTDFSRFNSIKEKVKKKEIDIIVFKNSSRLGRNQKEALEFVEYLEERGVEIYMQ